MTCSRPRHTDNIYFQIDLKIVYILYQMNCKMCSYKTTNVSDANKHAMDQHDKPIGQCFKKKRKYVKKKNPDVYATIDTRSILLLTIWQN